MGSPNATNNIVLFNYAASPFGKRVSWYLQLRGIQYAICEQPFVMPRPDLEKLGVKYRRIPILAIGRDIYLDTRLILRKLEDEFPHGQLGSDRPEDKFVEKLLEKYMIEGPVFAIAAGLVPTDFVQDPKFAKDRAGFCGREWTPEVLDKGRPECLAYVRNLFKFLETTILADGRKWLLKSEKPSLADIEAIWPLDWLVSLEGSMPPDVVSEKQFPKVYGWISRFRAALDSAKASAPEVESLVGDEAIDRIINSRFTECEGGVSAKDPLGITEGTRVEMYPVDWGSDYRDGGRLFALSSDEVTVTAQGRGDVELRIHAPRTGFRVTEVGRNGSARGNTRM